MFLFPGVLLTFAIFSKFNIGERHIVPLYPFALLVAGATWHVLRRHRHGLAIAVTIVVLNAADTARYAPDYLSYFNVFVDSRESYTLASDSNLDWGQGLLALREYERANPNEKTYLAYFGTVDPKIYGIRAEPLKANTRVTGTVICSATSLTGLYIRNAKGVVDTEGYRWLLQHPRKAVLNHSLHVFVVPESAQSGQ
jgi:hypothetical protein